MANLDFCRTTRFVSLDTHPANSSLVVTYEILVVVRDLANNRELCRRSKRDQFQIAVSALDHLNAETAAAAAAGGTLKGVGTLDLGQISEQIFSKCTILSDANRAEILEDIQLNLLYLVNRRQAQLAHPSRPSPSSASMRLRSNTPMSSGRLGLQSRQGSATSARSAKDGPNQKSAAASAESPLEVYQSFSEKELKLARRQDYLDYERLELFVGLLDEHLVESEGELNIERTSRSQVEDLETQLENLYGEADERRCAIAIIRRFVRNDEKLISVSSNRLLVCAILRILRDSEGTNRDRFMSESILYCLIRFTSFEDVFNSMALGEAALSGDNESLDLIRVTIDLLHDHFMWLAKNCEQDLRLLTSSSYYTNSLLVVLANILRLDCAASGCHRIKHRIILQHGTKLADILCVSLTLSAKHLARDIRSASKSHERLTVTLMEIFSIAKQMTIFKEFVNLVKSAARIQPLVDSLVAILNILQLGRPGSGSNQLQQVPATDRASLFKVYELEIELMLVINNLIYDARFRARFRRKNLLLKCVLRSLVVFLAASRKLSTLNPFIKSLVLIVPLKCLYELSCSDEIKRELFESRVIMRCLLEYLLSTATHLAAETETCRLGCDENSTGERSPLVAISELNLNEADQIVLGTRDACQYIVSLWMNLSSRPEAPFYKQTDEEHLQLLQSYIGLAVTNLGALLTLIDNPRGISKTQLGPLRSLHLMNYIHAKLVRNLSQFLDRPDYFRVEKLTSAVMTVLVCEQRAPSGTLTPVLAECLATLTNVVESLTDDQIENHKVRFGLILESLFSRRPSLIDGSVSTEVENDDLLLIAINFLGTLARRSEICTSLKTVQNNLVSTINQILELRTTDSEMIISCLFALDQLMRHAEFLGNLGSSLEGDQDGEQSLSTLRLIERLSSLVTHTNLSAIELSDQILSKLKQFEESRSLVDSITCQRRFVSYNSKWLNAIRANSDDPSNLTEAMNEEISSATGPRRVGLRFANNDDEDEEEADLDEYRHLRTINEDNARTYSRLTNTSSASRSSSRVIGAKGITGTEYSGEELVDDLEDEAEVDADDDEDTFSEPDINVIDSMSMIGHLTRHKSGPVVSSQNAGNELLTLESSKIEDLIQSSRIDKR